MISIETIDHLAERISRAIPADLGRAREDIHDNIRDVLTRALREFDLSTREEFEVQAALLRRTQERLGELELRVAELEAARTTG